MLVTLVALLAAAVIRWRHRLYFVALIGIAVAIAVGVHPYDHPAAPLGSLLKSFATGSTAGLALRNVARAIPLLALGLAMLLAAGVEALSAWWSRLGIAAAVAIGGLVAADMAPLWAGQFVDANLSRPSQIPSYYQAAANYMDARGNATRVMALPGIDFATYRWGSRTIKHHFCASCGCGTYSESPDWSTGKPDFDNPKVGINARLFDDFDLDAVPVTVIDGKNLW